MKQDDFHPPKSSIEDKTLHEKATVEFKKLNKSIGKIYRWTLWIVFLFFAVLIGVFLGGLVLVLLDIKIDRDFFSILAAFLAGSLGAGFGDKIFGGLRQFWDNWISHHK